MVTKDIVLQEINKNNRICLQPGKWNELYELLKNETVKERRGELPLPLIISAWWHTPLLPKIIRFQEHITWAEDHGFLQVVYDYFIGLPESDWYHSND